jgi:hydrogenase/urease accessory protein HupE
VPQFLLALALVLGLLLSPGSSAAHDELVSTSDVAIETQAIVWRVEVGFLGLRKAVVLPDREMDEKDLSNHERDIVDYLSRGVDVVADGRRLVGQPIALEPIYEPSFVTGRPQISRVALVIRFASNVPIQAVTTRVQFFSDLTSLHRALIRVSRNHSSEEHVLLGPSDLVLAQRVAPPMFWSGLPDFLRWGMFHIFIGYDHIAFLVGLLLAAKRLPEVFKVVTSFTLAHSVTILLSALDIVRIPSRLTEIMIAASIVYVGFENIYGSARGYRHRWLLAFGFGLVHGLGFATELRARLAALAGPILLPVISFNLGVEIGQLVIVALLFPLLCWARSPRPTTPPERYEGRLLRYGSLPILGMGLVLLVQRAVP